MKNFLGFLIALTLVFSFFVSPINAAGVKVSSEVKYSFLNDVFKNDFKIRFTNTSNSQTVLNYYTIFIPIDGISSTKATLNGKTLTTTIYKQKNGTELIINFKNRVLGGKDSLDFHILFNSQSKVDKDWGYAKILSQINGLNINKVQFEYPNDKANISYIDGAKSEKIKDGLYEFTNITKPSISLNFGSPITFDYKFLKKYINDSDDSSINEVVLPYTNQEQQFILSKIDPQPVTSRIDNDGNIILGFLVGPKDQEIVDIQGYVVKKDYLEDQKYNDWDISNIGYWNITNQFEKIRVTNYLKANNLEKNALSFNKYVIDKLKLQAGGTITGTTSFENALRSGADIAIERKDLAIAEDYVDLLIAILRENSIPARMVVGYIPQSSAFSVEGAFHSWVEYFDLDKKVWNTFDPSISDIYKIKVTEDFDTHNYIDLLVRSEYPNNPKLPYLNNGDVIVKPIPTPINPTFAVETSGSTIQNIGNIPIYFTNDTGKELLLPEQSVEIVKKGDVVLHTFYGEDKTVNIDYVQANSKTSVNILSEIIVFVLFITALLAGNQLYVRIKKNGK